MQTLSHGDGYLHIRPASHIRDAFEKIASVWNDIEADHKERKIMFLALIWGDDNTAQETFDWL